MEKILSTRNICVGACVALSLGALAQFGAVDFAKVTASAPKTAKSGHVLNTRVALTVPIGYHIYSPKFSGTGVPTSIELVNAPKGVKLEGVGSPRGSLLSGKVVFTPKLFIPKGLKGHRTFEYAVRFQQCNDKVCLPPKTVNVAVHTLVK